MGQKLTLASSLGLLFIVASNGTVKADTVPRQKLGDVQKEFNEIKRKNQESKVAFDIDSSPTLPVPSVSRNEPSTNQTVTQGARPLILLDRNGWNVTFSGFVELDVISDSTRSLLEIAGNSPIDPSNKVSGANGRTQFSVRNSRLAFAIQAPEVESWKTRGYIETDFLGFDPNPPGASGAGNSEAGLFNNPTMRIRHAYLQANTGGFQLLAGQTWELFGWQPYYFMGTAQVAPVPAMLFGRTSQIRAMQTIELEDIGTIQAAFGLARPPERDALYPDLQGGLRVAFNGRTSGFTGGASGAVKTQPMSFAISGLAREINYPTTAGGPGDTTNILASAIALDAMIPVLASSDGKDVGNTLSLLGEYSSGSGYGDQFPGWTGNISNPLSASSVNPSKNVNLDGGIGDYDATGAFNLVNLTTMNTHLQYHFPSSWKTFVNLGVGYLYSNNVNNLLPAAGQTSASKTPYNRESVGFANVFHYFTDQVRVGFEFAHSETAYADGTVGFNNRYQLTTLFIF